MLERIRKTAFSFFTFLLIFSMFNRELGFFGFDLRLLVVVFAGISLMLSPKLGFTNDFRIGPWKRATNFYVPLYFIVALISNLSWFWNGLPILTDQFVTIVVANVFNLVFMWAFWANRDLVEWPFVAKSVFVAAGFLLASMVAVYFGADLRNFGSQYEGGYSDGISNSLFSDVRFAGYAQDPNFASLFMVIWLGFIIFEFRRTKNWLVLSMFPLPILGLLLSFSKAVVVMILVGGLFALAYRLIWVSLLREMFILGCFIASIAATVTKLFPLPTFTLQTRQELWQGAIDAIWANPVFGAGLSSARSANLGAEWYVQLHSTIVQSFIETGIIGLVLLYLCIRRAATSAHPEFILVSFAYLGTALTYETMSHVFSIFVLFIVPLALSRANFGDKPTAAVYVINGITHGGAEKVVQNMIAVQPPSVRTFLFLTTTNKQAEVNLERNVDVYRLGENSSYLSALFKSWYLDRKLDILFARFDVQLATTHLPYSHLLVRCTKYDNEFLFVNHGMVGVSAQGLSRSIVRALYRNRKVIAVSNELATEDLSKKFGVTTPFMSTIYNPVGIVDEEEAPELLPTARENLIISVGRLEREKGTADSIKAFERSQLYKKGYRFEIYGEGTLEDELQEQINEARLSDSVVLKGFITNPFKIMRRAKALIHAASYESFGMVVIEAHRNGLPVVAYTAEGGIKETMPGELSHFLAPQGDVDALADLLRSVVSEKNYPTKEASDLLARVEPRASYSEYIETYERWCTDTTQRVSR